MKINYQTRPTFKKGDEVRVREDCEWEWKNLRNKELTVTGVSENYTAWKGSKINYERPGLALKEDPEIGSYYDSFGFEHI